MSNKSTGPVECRTMGRAVDWPVGGAVLEALGTMGFRDAVPWRVLDQAIEDAASRAVDRAVFFSKEYGPKHCSIEDFLEGVEAR